MKESRDTEIYFSEPLGELEFSDYLDYLAIEIPADIRYFQEREIHLNPLTIPNSLRKNRIRKERKTSFKGLITKISEKTLGSTTFETITQRDRIKKNKKRNTLFYGIKIITPFQKSLETLSPDEITTIKSIKEKTKNYFS